MRMLALFAILQFCVATARADDVPKGEIAKYSFSASKIFPGTVRDYWIYVPRQYDPTRKTCLYVNQDGIQFKAPEVFDRLIAAKEMPVTIGVFVMHGRVPARTPNAIDRFNRSFEYDGLGNNYVRFLLEELLPDAEKKTTADGRPIRFSNDGNDRAIGGSSSGAICAFTAAWERPDSFRRVFSAIGTYVGLRGGNNYPTLIRKTEPKPIRVFLQDGSNDLNIYGGDWWMANQELERALKFAGYEVEHAWDDGKHSNDGGTKVFPEAMRWLWKDWPAPVKAGLGSPQMREILAPGEGWTLVSEKLSTAGKLVSNSRGSVFFSDPKSAKVFRIDPAGNLDTFLVDAKLELHAVGSDDSLFATLIDASELARFDAAGKRHAANLGFDIQHMIAGHAGRLYALGVDQKNNERGLWYVDPAGSRKRFDRTDLLDSGLALSTDQSSLFVSNGLSNWIDVLQVQPDGTVANSQRFVHLHALDPSGYSGAGCMTADRDGRLYIATIGGVQISDQLGRVNCILPIPEKEVTGLCFGGTNFDTLFVAYGDKIYKRKVKVRGANAFEPPIKPKKPGL